MHASPNKVFSECIKHVRTQHTPFLRPKAIRSCGGLIVHLVDGHYELGYAQRLGQLCVLTSLPSSLKTCLKLTLRRQSSSIQLAC